MTDIIYILKADKEGGLYSVAYLDKDREIIFGPGDTYAVIFAGPGNKYTTHRTARTAMVTSRTERLWAPPQLIIDTRGREHIITFDGKLEPLHLHAKKGKTDESKK